MKWTKVKDKMPKENTQVFVRMEDTEEFKAELNETMSSGGGISYEWYTPDGHWIPGGIIEWRIIDEITVKDD